MIRASGFLIQEARVSACFELASRFVSEEAYSEAALSLILFSSAEAEMRIIFLQRLMTCKGTCLQGKGAKASSRRRRRMAGVLMYGSQGQKFSYKVPSTLRTP